MALNKRSGFMYPWVTHTHTHIGGKCAHECVYCSIQALSRIYPVLKTKYSGEAHMVAKELDVDYGTGKTIFMENCTDLFERSMPETLIAQVLAHCRQYPRNTYVFQTKNPGAFIGWLPFMPPKVRLGTTIETNRDMGHISKAPAADMRSYAMACVKTLAPEIKTFVTLEPLLDFDVHELAALVAQAMPDYYCPGADSKGYGFDKIPVQKIRDLMSELRRLGIPCKRQPSLKKVLK